MMGKEGEGREKGTLRGEGEAGRAGRCRGGRKEVGDTVPGENEQKKRLANPEAQTNGRTDRHWDRYDRVGARETGRGGEKRGGRYGRQGPSPPLLPGEALTFSGAGNCLNRGLDLSSMGHRETKSSISKPNGTDHSPSW